MALKIRAVYEDGQIKLLDPIELQEGQHLTISVETVNQEETIRAALGDLVQWPDANYDEDAWVEAHADDLAQRLSKGRSLSAIIAEERDSGW